MTAYYPLVEFYGNHYGSHVVDEKGKTLTEWGCFHAHRTEGAAKKCADRMVRLFEGVEVSNQGSLGDGR